MWSLCRQQGRRLFVRHRYTHSPEYPYFRNAPGVESPLRPSTAMNPGSLVVCASILSFAIRVSQLKVRNRSKCTRNTTADLVVLKRTGIGAREYIRREATITAVAKRAPPCGSAE